MNKMASGKANLYVEFESVKKETEAGNYDDEAGESVTLVTEQTSDMVALCSLRRMLFVIAAVSAVALVMAIATLILALTAMKPQNDSTAKAQDYGRTGAIKSNDNTITEKICENVTALVKKMENNAKELNERLASTQLELKTVNAQLDGQIAGLWNATNSTTDQLSELRNVWKAANATAEKVSNLTDKNFCFAVSLCPTSRPAVRCPPGIAVLPYIDDKCNVDTSLILLGKGDKNITEITHAYFNPRYSFNYSEAGRVCEVLNGTLATFRQMQAAWHNGFQRCSYGWLAGGISVVPMQERESRGWCHDIGLNAGLSRPKDSRIDAYCVGVEVS